jgi:hypothetical protein
MGTAKDMHWHTLRKAEEWEIIQLQPKNAILLLSILGWSAGSVMAIMIYFNNGAPPVHNNGLTYNAFAVAMPSTWHTESACWPHFFTSP